MRFPPQIYESQSEYSSCNDRLQSMKDSTFTPFLRALQVNGKYYFFFNNCEAAMHFLE